MIENGEIYTAGKNFTLPPAVTAVTNSTSEALYHNVFTSECKQVFSCQLIGMGQSKVYSEKHLQPKCFPLRSFRHLEMHGPRRANSTHN